MSEFSGQTDKMLVFSMAVRFSARISAFSEFPKAIENTGKIRFFDLRMVVVSSQALFLVWSLIGCEVAEAKPEKAIAPKKFFPQSIGFCLLLFGFQQTQRP